MEVIDIPGQLINFGRVMMSHRFLFLLQPSLNDYKVSSNYPWFSTIKYSLYLIVLVILIVKV
jgi:hypothetical protein